MSDYHYSQDKTSHRWISFITSVMFSLLLTACGVALAPKPFTIGMVTDVSIFAPCIEGFKAGMTGLGYVEGKNVIYIYHGIVESNPQAVDSEVKNLLAQDVDMFFVVGKLSNAGVRQVVAGTDIPVVFGAAAKPVENGLVKNLRHPGGNLTGIQVGSGIPKALEWLVKIAPKAKKVYIPYNPNDAASVTFLPELDKVAPQLKIELVFQKVSSAEEAITAIKNLPKDIDAIFSIPSPTLDPKNNELGQAAIKRGLPMGTGHLQSGTMLFTLGPDYFEVGKQAARLADQIHQGLKPADLPVETAEFFLTINLKTAQALKLDIPDSVLQQANTIIR